MKAKYLYLAVAVLPLALVVAQNKPAVPAVPTVSAEHQRDYFKAQLALTQAQENERAAQASLSASMELITKDCGEKFLPQMGPEGLPICIAKPEPPKTPPSAPDAK